jgi:hypothetical protein
MSFAAAPALAQGRQSEEEAKLAAIDAQKRFPGTDLSYELEMTTTGGNEAEKRSRMQVYRRDGKKLLVALVLEPGAEKGEGYLRKGDNLWFFDVETGAFVHRVLFDAIGESEMESGDIEPDSLEGNYGISSESSGKIGAIEARVLELEERGAQVYPRLRVWIRAGDGLLLKEEYFGASGRLLRYVLYPAHTKLGGIALPSTSVYVDALDPSRRTTAIMKSPSLAPIPESVFAKTFLERAR